MAMKRKTLGKYIVIAPDICHGKPTFIGTRIMVWQVLDRVAKGRAFDQIVAQWPGSFPEEAVTEAVLLAKEAFLDQNKVQRPKTKSM
jgi:uncharacterized protein (DUF433 family)